MYSKFIIWSKIWRVISNDQTIDTSWSKRISK